MLSFFGRSTAYTCGKLCRQYILLVGLALLCLLLPNLLGSVVQKTLEDGVDFAGITLAITAPEGDPIPELVEKYMGHMKDISRYCSIVAMEREEAMQALKDAQVLAVLELPEGFVSGIIDGTNPDVLLIIDENRPVESLLTLWLGQSATDLLATAQAGIYAVLEEYDPSIVQGISYSDVVMDINMRYVNWVLNRQEIYEQRTVSATQTLPVREHYALSLLAWLCLSLAPLFYPVYGADRLRAKKRLRSIGYGSAACFASDLAACVIILWLITALPLMAIMGWSVLKALLCALIWAAFCACFGSLCCLLTGSAAQCGAMDFLVSLAALVVAGGVIPPVMLPQSLRKLGEYAPVTWLRNVAASLMELDTEGAVAVPLGVSVVVMIGVSVFFYHRRVCGREVAQ